MRFMVENVLSSVIATFIYDVAKYSLGQIKCEKDSIEKYGKTGRWNDIWKNGQGTLYGSGLGVFIETAERNLAVHAVTGKKEITQRKNAGAFNRRNAGLHKNG